MHNSRDESERALLEVKYARISEKKKEIENKLNEMRKKATWCRK